MLHITKRARDSIIIELENWLREEGIELSCLLGIACANIEEINVLVNMYGWKLYEAGRPLNFYSETINTIASLKLQIRRSLHKGAGIWLSRGRGKNPRPTI